MSPTSILSNIFRRNKYRDHPPSRKTHISTSDRSSDTDVEPDIQQKNGVLNKPDKMQLPDEFVAGNGWMALKKALVLVKDLSSGPLFPLQAAIIGILAIMEHAERVSGAQLELFELAHRLKSLQSVFQVYQTKKELPRAMYDRLDDILVGLSAINNTVEAMVNRGIVKRTVTGFKDVENVLWLVRRFLSLLETFKIGTMLHTELVVEGIQTDNILRQLKPVTSAGIQALSQSGCMEGTRVSILKDLKKWSAESTAHRVFWLDGMAGTGKSAIARTLSRFLDENWLLGGSFFCLRGNESRVDVRRILPTLAWYLARRDPHYRTSLMPILQDNSDVKDYTVEKQVEILFEKPLADVQARQGSQNTRPPLVLIIDALDECADTEEVQLLLNKLLSVSSNLYVKFFLTSRAERHIRSEFDPRQPGLHRILRLHDIDKDLVVADIRLYLSTHLSAIRSSFPASFVSEWPSPKDLDTLTQLAGSLFIYAFTAVKFLEGPFAVARLKTLTGHTGVAGRPFHKALDDMYTLVLSTPFNTDKHTEVEIATTKDILTTVIAAREPLRLSDLSIMLMADSDTIRANLDGIRAVINVPPLDAGFVTIFHTSFIDFLTTVGRAPEKLMITLSAAHHELANTCLRIMKDDLCFNIANCKTSYLPNSKQVLTPIPESLKYSCLHWSHHAVAASDAGSILPQVEDVLFDKFLFWLEVLSVTSTTGSASSILMQPFTSRSIVQHMTERLSSFLHYANEFVMAFREAIELSVAHIYLSALPSLGNTSKILKSFQSKYPSTIKMTKEGIAQQRRPVLELIGHTSSVLSVRFSQDGSRVASASDDNTIRIWDARTGDQVVKSLEGHARLIHSVSFSPNGDRVVSGSWDNTIRIWDTKTGEEVANFFDGHAIYSVAFSPDGKLIASGSDDNTIRIRDTRLGLQLMEPLVGHTNCVTSIGFSPDGTQIVSGSKDNTIRIWDSNTGQEMVEPLKGHAASVWSVGFSPDGKRIVSGSDDTTIRIWDARTGKEVMEPLKGHRDSVFSVMFSPDGSRIVSGSEDNLIRIWNSETGKEMMKPLRGHTDCAYSVGFSPDGTQVVSASLDKTIRIWDATPDQAVKPLTGHTDCVYSVGFSSDGNRIVSGSWDRSVYVWDVETGWEEYAFKGSTSWVNSVAFSPDGTRVASGSQDNNIQIWDSTTGEEATEPLMGHLNCVTSVAYSPDGSRLVSGSYDSTIRIWDLHSGEESIKPLVGHRDWVCSVGFSPNGSLVVSGSYDKTVRVWDATTGRAINCLKGHAGRVFAVGFSPDGKLIVSGSEDKTIRIWNATTGEEVLKPLVGHSNWVNSVAFSPDGNRIVSGSGDMTIRLWDVTEGREVMKPLVGHTNWVKSVAFSPNGNCIVSGSWDNTVRVWDITSREDVQFDTVMASDGWIRGPDGELIFWVLPEWRTFLEWSPCTRLIGQGRILCDTSDFVHGKNWMACRSSPAKR